MNNLYVFAGIGAVDIAGGGTYFIHNAISKSLETPKEVFSTKYSKALLNTESNDAIWDVKLSSLESVSSSPKNKHLIKAKSEKKASQVNEAKASLKRGCQEIYSQFVENQDAFNDFKSFCSYSNKDKIASTRQLVSGDADFTGSWGTFSQANRSDLYAGFQEIHAAKGSSSDDSGWKGKMLVECNKIAEGIFEGEIGDFTRFCTKEKGSGVVASSSSGHH